MNEFTWNKDFVENYLLSELQKAGIKYQIVLRDVGITKLINDLNKAAGKDDIILSFHLNSGVAAATGTETLYWHTSTKGKKLAGLVQKNLVKVLGLADRGIKIRRKPLDTEDAKNQRGWEIFQKTKVPFVMLESFFISNDKDLKIGTEKKGVEKLQNILDEYVWDNIQKFIVAAKAKDNKFIPNFIETFSEDIFDSVFQDTKKLWI